MKINGKKPGDGANDSVKKAGDRGKVEMPHAKYGESAENGAVLPQRAIDLSRAKRLLEAVPDISGEMIVKLKSDIEHGSYNVDAGKVAEKMIAKALRDSIYSGKSDK